MPKIRSGCYAWTPAPTSAYKAIEQLRIARHKRQKSSHIFVCPRLFTCNWRAQLHKTADLVFEVPVGNAFWTSNMHEPLVIGLILPTFKHRRWFCAHTLLMDHCKKEIRILFDQRKDVTALLKMIFKLSADSRRMSADDTTRTLPEPESFVY